MKREEPVPEDLIQFLRMDLLGFKREPEHYQWQLAKMLWDGGSKRRKHQAVEGAMSFTHAELNQAFGRGIFSPLSERLGFFEVSKGWSKDNHQTRAYWFSPKIIQLREKYFKRRWRTNTRLILSDGSLLRSVPTAVASKDMDGITTYAWRNAKSINSVSVDLWCLEELRLWLEQKRKEIKAGRYPQSLLSPTPTIEMIDRLHAMTAQVIRMGKTDLAGTGYITQRYVEASSGRLYAKGINLQNCPALIKQAALHGQWEYDFANCHFAILDQMSARFGYQCDAIRHYIDNKEQVRRQIASEAGIYELEAKICLLAIMYGAKTSEWHENAIPKMVGQEGAKRLNTVPLFSGIARDIEQARRVILAGWGRNRRGNLVNDFGKTLQLKPKGAKRVTVSPAQQLAHLIQGVEALALKAVIDLFPDDIVLLQHDGFVSKERQDVRAISAALEAATGYQFGIKEERIQLDPDAQFLKAKNQNDLGV